MNVYLIVIFVPIRPHVYCEFYSHLVDRYSHSTLGCTQAFIVKRKELELTIIFLFKILLTVDLTCLPYLDKSNSKIYGRQFRSLILCINISKNQMHS